jgi:hypothetical protein
VSLIVGNTVYVAGAGDSRAVFCYGNQVQRVSLDHKPYLEEESRRVRAVGGLVKVDSDYAKQYRVCKLFAGTPLLSPRSPHGLIELTGVPSVRLRP